jgi:hypothetical protein
MGRHANLKDLAYGLAHTFISRHNDLDGYWAVGMLHALARSRGSTRLAFDLWGGIEEDASPVVDAMRARYGEWLRQGLRRHGFPDGYLKRATIALEFEREDLWRLNLGRWPGPPMVCEVYLVDAQDRVVRLQTVGACWPHDPARAPRRAQADGIKAASA